MRFLNIVCYGEGDPMSVYDSRSITHSLNRPSLCWLSTVQSIACCEKKRKMALQSDHCENSEILLHNIGLFNSERVATSFYVQTSSEVVNRNSVARMKCSNESGSLHV